MPEGGALAAGLLAAGLVAARDELADGVAAGRWCLPWGDGLGVGLTMTAGR